MENIGILLRGKSIENLSVISDKFERCFIVNDWNKEIKIFENQLRDKDIAQFSNSMHETILLHSQYKRFEINEVFFAFTRSMLERRKLGILKAYQERGIEYVGFLDEKYKERTKQIRNTGVCAIFYAAEVLKAKNIWIAGLEFYKENYLVKPNYPHQRPKTEKIKLEESFIKIVEEYPQINFNLVTYYKGLPKLPNLHEIKI